MIKIPLREYPYYYEHNHGDDACGGVAFYLRDYSDRDDLHIQVSAEDAVYLDGTEPDRYTLMKCSACGKELTRQPLLQDLYPRPAPGEEVF
jgi:hypothetical protein